MLAEDSGGRQVGFTSWLLHVIATVVSGEFFILPVPQFSHVANGVVIASTSYG